MRAINEIIIHCSATRPTWMAGHSMAAKVQEIARWHTDRGWKAIGYHWLIDRNGEVAAGRPEHIVGAHVKGRNAHSIGVCLLGGHGADAYDEFYDHFTVEQKDALLNLIDEMENRWDISKISGHNEYSAKGCPGFQVGPWLREVSAPQPDMAQEADEPKPGFFTKLIEAIARLFK